MDVTLLGRYYERYADHAVAVAKRVVYLVTGEHADELQQDIQPVTGVEGRVTPPGAAGEGRRGRRVAARARLRAPLTRPAGGHVKWARASLPQV